VSEEALSRDMLEVFAGPLGAVDNVSFSRAVDRLFDTDTLLGMLDQGIAFQRSLELVGSQVMPTTGIPPTSKRRPGLARPSQAEIALPQLVSHRQPKFR